MSAILTGVLAAALTWAPVGPEGGSVTAIAAGETSYAGTAQGRVFRSTAGGTWTAVAELPSPIRKIAASGGTAWVLAGTDLFRVDGTSVTRRATGVTEFTAAHASVYTAAEGARSIAVDAADGRRQWIVRADGELHSSADGGTTWTRVPIDEPIARVFAHPRRSGKAFAIAASERGYRTIDGVSWSPVHYLTGELLFDPADERVFYAVDGPGRLFRFVNDGERFTIIHGGPILTATFDTDGTLIAGFREKGVQRSVDGGATWSARNDGLLATEIHSLAASGNLVYAGGVGTMFRSRDRGETWDPVFLLRLLPGPFRAIAIDESDPQRVWIGAGVSMWFTGDGGAHFNRLLWVPNLEPQVMISATIDPADRNVVWVLMSESLLRFRVDPVVLDDRTPARETFHTFALDGSALWLGGAKLHHSMDGGVTWSEVDLHDVTSILPGTPMLVGTASGDIFRSDDRGSTFSRVANLGARVTSISTDGRGFFAAAGGVFTSNDANMWRPAAGLTRATVLAGSLAATEGAGVWAAQETVVRRRAVRR